MIRQSISIISNQHTNNNSDNLVFKPKIICSSASHGTLISPGQPTHVCVELGCSKKAICQRCAQIDHASHKIEAIEKIHDRAVKCIEQFGKSDSNPDIAIIEKFEESIQSEFLKIQISLAKALKNFSERSLLYKESIKRRKLDAIYKFECTCEAIRCGKSVNIQAFNEQYKQLNEQSVRKTVEEMDLATMVATTAAAAEPELRRVYLFQSDLESLQGRLTSIGSHLANQLKNHTALVNQAFSRAVADDEHADPKLKVLDTSNNNIIIEPSVSSAINDISFDFLDINTEDADQKRITDELGQESPVKSDQRLHSDVLVEGNS